MSVVVFAGLTLSAPEVAAALDCVCLPPVRQGDVWRAMQNHRPRAIGIVDGVFLDVASVWHREILWAMSEGVHVFGAASMGALRAAELDAFGMRGVGRIYAAYRDGAWPGFDEPFEDDDEVAVIHAPAAAGGAALCDAMVDLRATLLAAAAAGVIDAATCGDLARRMRALHFPDRSFAALADIAPPALRDWLPAGRVSQKRLDALAMLAELARFVATDPPPLAPGFRFERALVWERFIRSVEALPDPDAAALAALRSRPDRYAAVRQAALARMALLANAAPVDPAAVRAAFDRFRAARGLLRHDDIVAWQRQSGLDADRLVLLMQRQAALDTAPEPPGLEAAMLDVLRTEPP